jgi:Na+-transporting methylmalonyl-CoA/oxaloacetate decarboxylase gamma subunit
MENLANFWNTVLTQRAWSWTVIGIGYLLAFLLVRNFFLHGLIKRARALNSKWYHEIKKVYAKKCISGWILFLISFLMMIFFWQTANLQQASLYEVGVLFLIILTVLLSIMSQVIAFGTSAIHVLKQVENNQMTL